MMEAISERAALLIEAYCMTRRMKVDGGRHQQGASRCHPGPQANSPPSFRAPFLMMSTCPSLNQSHRISMHRLLLELLFNGVVTVCSEGAPWRTAGARQLMLNLAARQPCLIDPGGAGATTGKASDHRRAGCTWCNTFSQRPAAQVLAHK